MKLIRSLAVLIPLAITGLSVHAQSASGLISPEAQAHIDAAMAIAKPDLIDAVESMCPRTRSAPRPATPLAAPAAVVPGAAFGPDMSKPVEATRVFDNMYFVGAESVGAWVINTSDGIIMIDSLLYPENVEQMVLPGMKKFGLDPAKIKYVLVSHAHGDHQGGAQYLKEHFGARIVMSEPDWEFVVTNPVVMANGAVDKAPRPKRDSKDIGFTDHSQITLGDTTVTMVVTPGHTPGTTAMLVPVKWHDKTYTVMVWGGGSLTQSVENLEKFNSYAKPLKTAGRLTTHPGMDGLANLAQLRQNPNGPNPFLMGEAKFARYLDIALECAKASVRPARPAPPVVQTP